MTPHDSDANPFLSHNAQWLRDNNTKPEPDSDAREVVRLPGFDAMEWVAMWRETIAEHPEIPHDDATMLGWFANAIMRGYDEYPRRPHDDQVSLPLPLAQRILAVLDNMPREFRALAAELRAHLPKEAK